MVNDLAKLIMQKLVKKLSFIKFIFSMLSHHSVNKFFYKILQMLCKKIFNAV